MEHDSNFELRESAEPRVIEWVAATGMVIGVSILIPMNISLSTQILRYIKKPNVSKLIMAFSLTTTILFLLAAISVSICTVLVLISDDHGHELIITEAFAKSSLSLYFISQTAMIFLFVIKTHLTFKGSNIGYSPLTTKCLYCSSVFFVVFFVFFDFTLLYERWDIFIIVAGSWVILYFGLSLSLCIAFIRKIELLMELSHKSGQSIDEEIFFVVIKHALLVPIAIFSSFVCFTSTLVVNYLTHPGEWVPSAMFWIVVDCAISSISIYLLFGWNDAKYKKYCSKLHAACTNLKILKIQKNHSDLKLCKTSIETATTTTATISKTSTESPAITSNTCQSIEASIDPSLLANDSLQQSNIDLHKIVCKDDKKATLN